MASLGNKQQVCVQSGLDMQYGLQSPKNVLVIKVYRLLSVAGIEVLTVHQGGISKGETG